MTDDQIRRVLAALALFGATLLSAPPVRADAVLETAPRLACEGVLSFGDALALPVRMTVDRERAEVTTPDCRKYPYLARFCRGTLLTLRDHHYVFDGFESPQNSKLWATLHRPSEAVRANADDAGIESMRVLFLGRCEPTNWRRPAKAPRPR
ncbi:MAG TPA: hypothetical protein VEK55_09300 [Xanthobacteraceae bacterium]|nr:hypothetical protein [Xanthobacteraceae bacterium]